MSFVIALQLVPRWCLAGASLSASETLSIVDKYSLPPGRDADAAAQCTAVDKTSWLVVICAHSRTAYSTDCLRPDAWLLQQRCSFRECTPQACVACQLLPDNLERPEHVGSYLQDSMHCL